MNLKKIAFFLILFSLFPLLFTQKAFASDANFSLYPNGGVVKDTSKGFTVDVLLDSGGFDITQARFVLKFDPNVVQLTSTSKNNSLFNQWPDDESTIDNENGVVMLTGFTQSGNGDLYNTEGDPDVMARLTFKIISTTAKKIDIDFVYDSTADLFTSEILKNGSPPINVLTSKPDSVEYTYGGYVNPSTAIQPTQIGIALGLVLIGIGVFLTSSRTGMFRKKKGTVVLYD